MTYKGHEIKWSIRGRRDVCPYIIVPASAKQLATTPFSRVCRFFRASIALSLRARERGERWRRDSRTVEPCSSRNAPTLV